MRLQAAIPRARHDDASSDPPSHPPPYSMTVCERHSKTPHGAKRLKHDVAARRPPPRSTRSISGETAGRTRGSPCNDVHESCETLTEHRVTPPPACAARASTRCSTRGPTPQWLPYPLNVPPAYPAPLASNPRRREQANESARAEARAYRPRQTTSRHRDPWPMAATNRCCAGPLSPRWSSTAACPAAPHSDD